MALNLIRGSPEDSYSLLPQYFDVLRSKNPGSVYHIIIDAEDIFMYYFLEIGSCVRGFLQCIRPVIAMDGSHLKGKYKGTMLIATCLDGNNQIFPIALAVVDSENDTSWKCFKIKLHKVIEEVPKLVFISYRCKSIQKAFYKVFPTTTHGIFFTMSKVI